LQVIDAGGGRRQRDRIDFALRRIEPRGVFPAAATLRPVWEKIAAPQRVVLLSDGFDDGVLQLAAQLSAANRDLVYLRLLTVDERDFAIDGSPRFCDPEQPARSRRVDAQASPGVSWVSDSLALACRCTNTCSTSQSMRC
jgi:hypothetical protein